MRAAWLSDIHLNFLDGDGESRFLEDLGSTRPDIILISGDICEAPTVCHRLITLHDSLKVPVYFVLGNHDFYRGSIEQLTHEVAVLSQQHPGIIYLTKAGVQQLTPTTCVIGHDSWADGRLGDFANSDVVLNDYVLIKELTNLDSATLHAKLKALGDKAAEYLAETLPLALRNYSETFVVTHVPPFREACWHRGRTSGDDYLPHFGCKAVGEVLRRCAAAHPERRVTVLCGHTHGDGEAQILENLKVITAGAEYGRPRIQQVFELA